MTPQENEHEIKCLADELLAIRSSPHRQPLDANAWAGFCPMNFEQAYRVQDLVAESLQPISGWKAYRLPQSQRVQAAPIFKADCYQNNLLDPTKAFRGVLVEAEFGYRLAEDIDPTGSDYTLENVVRVLDAIVPLIEIVDSRLKSFELASPYWHIADNCLNGGFVLGQTIADWRDVQLVEQSVDLLVDDQLMASGGGWTLTGSPLQLIVDFINTHSSRCGGLKKGQVIATGSVTGVTAIPRGASVRAHYEGLNQQVLADF